MLKVSALAGASRVDSGEIGGCHFRLTENRRRWLAQLDSDPSRLHDTLEHGSPTRLGLYFEALWHFFLAEDPDTDLLAHNLPVHDKGKTLGEFDCLYYCREEDKTFHLELAVKYFLGYRQPDADKSQILWYGPNSRDRLDLKLAHMLDRQIHLSDKALARPVLEALGVTSLHKQIAFHGYLFQPWQTAFTPPAGYNSRATSGIWLPQAQLPNLLCDGVQEHFLVLPRLRWLSPALAGDQDEILSGKVLVDRVDAHFVEHNRPLLIAALDKLGEEQQRFFVTPRGWPEALL